MNRFNYAISPNVRHMMPNTSMRPSRRSGVMVSYLIFARTAIEPNFLSDLAFTVNAGAMVWAKALFQMMKAALPSLISSVC